MNARNFLTANLTMTLLLIATIALAAAQISIETIIEKQETVLVDGKEQVHYVPAETTVPGDTLRFTLIYKNSGDEAAADVVLDNPIPKGTVYLANTATGADRGDLVFSIDGGATYKKPTLLSYSVTLPNGSTESRVAPPEQYTHVRWRISSIPPGGTGQVAFKALVL